MKNFLYCILASAIILTGCNKEDDPQYTEDYGSITGVVTDFATGEPVRNANVQLRPTGETTLTGTDGMYEFKSLTDGKYSITVSKAEYTDLIDDHVIDVTKGKTMRRDVQITRIPTYIRITDMNGNDIDCLDFGSESSVVIKAFNVYNNGTVGVHCETVYSCNWISSVTSLPETIAPGTNAMVTVNIDRTRLALGDNATELFVRSNNGNNKVQIKAIGCELQLYVPEVERPTISSINGDYANVFSSVIDDGGGNIIDKGFEVKYESQWNEEAIYENYSLGPGNNNFRVQIDPYLHYSNKCSVRAWAKNASYTGYSFWVNVWQ
ncbi:MAG: carboxypeptidase regulatory-like domain-containing protein [Bacteroidales bacterium]|nr:carboxypeptidase regulatory-like domain-containing protein [Bacteroidales bacterium]